MTNLYFVRHAEPNYDNHDDLTRELTAKGLEERKLVTTFLVDKDIDLVLSSPFKRAIDTVKDFADKKGFTIGIIEDFRERKVDSVWIEDFNSFCKKQWENFDYKLSDGECLREVQERNIAALSQVLSDHKDKNIVIGSHGTALGTIINFFDPAFGFNSFNEIRDLMPFIVKIMFDNEKCIDIQKYNLFGRK